MNLNDHFWYYSKALPIKFCNEILQEGIFQKEKMEKAVVGATPKGNLSKKQIKDLNKQRNSNIVWLSNKWIYKEIMPFVFEANKLAKWNFNLNGYEICQFTKYNLNQHYDWHCDAWTAPYGEDQKDKNLVGKVRKLSVTVSLSNPDEYEGGELEFDFRNTKPNKKTNFKSCTEIKEKGSLVVFPSFVWHRVKPVTKGIRHSLVIWTLGESFK